MLPEGFMFKLLDVMKMGLTYIDENQNVVYLMGLALRKSLDEMSVLFEAARLVNSSMNIKQVLEGVVKLA